MNFFNAMEESVGNNTYSENGALVYKSSTSTLADLVFNVTKEREGLSIDNYIEKLFKENPIYAIATSLYIRDIHNGMGERKAGRTMFNYLMDIFTKEQAIKYILQYIDIGRFDDLLEYLYISDTSNKDVVKEFIESQLKKDLKADRPSLLAKWMPSINASDISRGKALILIDIFNDIFANTAAYRKKISMMRKKLNLVESNITNKDYNKIKYEEVPGQAMKKYHKAFFRNDLENFSNYIESVNNNEKKINTGTMNPVEIVRGYIDQNNYNYYYEHALNIDNDDTLETLWKNLPSKDISNFIVIRDGSESMLSGYSEIPMNVGDALTIYCSEHNKSMPNKFITFSDHPELVDLSGFNKLYEKLKVLREVYTDYTDTNIEAVFDIVLKTALDHKFTQEQIPNLLIISDMQFNFALRQFNLEHLFETISKKWEKEGYKLPKLVFWNVNSRSSNGSIPITQNELGVILVSGYSQNILNIVMNRELSPEKAILKELADKGYIKKAEDIWYNK